MNKAEIEKACQAIKIEIETDVDVLDISAVQKKLMNLTSLMGLSAETMKEAKAIIGYRQKDIINMERNSGLSASILKMKIQSELWEEEAIYIYCDRLNAAISHACDSLRTVISLYKTEMQHSI